jgi:glycine/serine hydroxymethyltransferase
MAFLDPGDTFIGFDLASGGHLTHGHPINFSGKTYKAVNYSVNKNTERIDMDEVRGLAIKHRPKMIVSGLTAYPPNRFWRISENCGGGRGNTFCGYQSYRRFDCRRVSSESISVL